MKHCSTGFNGVRRDLLSGNIPLGNGYRAFTPQLMRCLSPDNQSPFAAGGLNPYAYCLNDPVNRIDPDGHISWSAWAGIAGGIAGVALAPLTAGSSLAIAALIATSSAVSGALAIASGVTENAASGVSAILGWASLITGLPAMGIGVWKLGQAAVSGVRQGLTFIGKLERGEGVIGIALSGRGAAGGSQAVYPITRESVTLFDAQRIMYEMEAYDAAHVRLNLPARVGARPELGPHRQIVHFSQPRLPVYSQELRAIYPVPESLERQLNAYYEQLNIRSELRAFRVTVPQPAGRGASAAVQQRPLPPAPQRPLTPPPQRPLPPPPYSASDPHPLQSYPTEPDYIARRGNPPEYTEMDVPETWV